MLLCPSLASPVERKEIWMMAEVRKTTRWDLGNSTFPFFFLSSCWWRVTTAAATDTFGRLHLPRLLATGKWLSLIVPIASAPVPSLVYRSRWFTAPSAARLRFVFFSTHQSLFLLGFSWETAMKEPSGPGNRGVECVFYSLDTKFFGSSCHRWWRRTRDVCDGEAQCGSRSVLSQMIFKKSRSIRSQIGSPPPLCSVRTNHKFR